MKVELDLEPDQVDEIIRQALVDARDLILYGNIQDPDNDEVAAALKTVINYYSIPGEEI